MRNRKKNKFYFNMVEIILAIGVLAIGFSAVLGLFPVAVKIVRSSQMESAISQMSGDLYSYYMSLANTPLMNRQSPNKRLEEEYWYRVLFADSVPANSIIETVQQYESQISGRNKFFLETEIEDVRNAVKNSGNNFLNGKYFLQELSKAVKDAVDDGKDVRTELGKNPFNMLPHLNLFRPALPDQFPITEKHVMFYMVKGDADFSRIDLSAQILVWKTQMAQINGTTLMGYNEATVLNFEVSWPINVPYDEREIRHYQFLIINPKKVPI